MAGVPASLSQDEPESGRLDLRRQTLAQLLGRFAALGPPRASHGDGFEVLGAHDRTGASATVEAGAPVLAAPGVVADARHADAVLARRADRHHPVVGEAGVVVDLDDALARQVGRVVQRGLAVVDRQVDGTVGRSLDDDAQQAGLAQFPGEVSARVRIEESARGGGFGDHGVSAGTGEDPARRSGHEDQQVVGSQRVGAGRHLGRQVVRRQPLAADERRHQLVRHCLAAGAARGEVHPQDLVVFHLPLSCGSSAPLRSAPGGSGR